MPSPRIGSRDTRSGRPRRGAVGVVLCCAVWLPVAASGQVLGGPRAQATAPPNPGMLTRFQTTFDVANLRGGDADRRFNWDVDTAIDVDVVDLGFVRGSVFIGVETIVGSEQRGVDPNQAGYTLEASAFLRLPRGELATTFHHVSRHLADRATMDSVSWNMAGVSYGDRFSLGPFGFEAGARGMKTAGRNGVDYDGQLEGHVNVARAITESMALIAGAEGAIVPIDRSKFGRDTRRGGRIEAGLRVFADSTALDIFVAWEQRIDPMFMVSDTTRWTQFGFRLVAPVPFRE